MDGERDKDELDCVLVEKDTLGKKDVSVNCAGMQPWTSVNLWTAISTEASQCAFDCGVVKRRSASVSRVLTGHGM
eukprot:6593107-Ditylum_brightwellii.AAC.1